MKKGYLNPGFKISSDPRERMFNNENSDMYIRVAKVVRVDYEKFIVDVTYVDGIGGQPDIPISGSGLGYRSFLGSMPSAGDMCVLGFSKSGGISKPIVLGFLNPAYRSSLNYDILGVPEAFKDVQKPLRPKMRKLYEGEILASSSQGSDILLDKDVMITNSSLVEMILKSSDKAIHMTALNYYLNTAGVRNQFGLIHRNDLLNDPQFSNLNFPTYLNSDGVEFFTPNLTSTINNKNPYGKETINDDNPAFIEHRLEVKEYEDPNIPVSRSNSGHDVDSFYKKNSDGSSSKPLVVQVMGTLVGNDPVGDSKKYGIILKPRIFNDSFSMRGTLDEQPCIAESGINETTTLAAAYSLKFPNSGTAFYVNKQGKYFANISASSSIDPMGSGESAEINLLGHTRMYMGKNADKNRSLTLGTAGGVSTNWGFDSDKNRSWDATFRKGVSWNILGSDSDSVALNMRVDGDVRVTIEGSRYTEIKGSDIRLVQGIIEDKYLGKKANHYVGDVNNTYGAKYVELSVGHHNQTFSTGISRTILGPNITAGSTNAESTEIKLGNSSHKMLLGNKTEQVVIGNHSTKVGIGNKSVSVNLGNYSVKCGLGNIDITTGMGTVTVKTNGQVTIKGNLGVKIQSAAKVTVEAPMVDIGKVKPLQGIVTGGPKGHKDYLTGLPLIGAVTVKSSAT
jgi:hypothetical protein